MIRYLLDKGADPNIKAHDDLDPLMAAVENGDKETVLLLIENGADVRTKTNLTTPVYIASEKGHEEIKRLLIEKRCSRGSRKILATQAKCIKKVEKLTLQMKIPILSSSDS